MAHSGQDLHGSRFGLLATPLLDFRSTKHVLQFAVALP